MWPFFTHTRFFHSSNRAVIDWSLRGILYVCIYKCSVYSCIFFNEDRIYTQRWKVAQFVYIESPGGLILGILCMLPWGELYCAEGSVKKCARNFPQMESMKKTVGQRTDRQKIFAFFNDELDLQQSQQACSRDAQVKCCNLKCSCRRTWNVSFY